MLNELEALRVIGGCSKDLMMRNLKPHEEWKTADPKNRWVLKHLKPSKELSVPKP